MGKDTNTKSIHATVTPELGSFVEQLIDAGRFTSQSEAVRAALRLLEDEERLRDMKLEALREKIQEGLESGEPEEWDIEEFLENARTRFDVDNQAEK
jgi:antitoxin ParD1/3/4